MVAFTLFMTTSEDSFTVIVREQHALPQEPRSGWSQPGRSQADTVEMAWVAATAERIDSFIIFFNLCRDEGGGQGGLMVRLSGAPSGDGIIVVHLSAEHRTVSNTETGIKL